MSTGNEFFTSSEVRGGFSAKRARLLLFQIESRTASLLIQSRRTVELYVTEESAERQNLAFFEALAAGRELPVRPTIREIERYATQWKELVPDTTTLRAALAYLLAQKYRFTRRDIPHIRGVLELESQAVQEAFQRQYHRSLDTIYSRRANPLDWAGWQWNKLSAWLEHLPPFWTAYALTFTQLVGASILALPIAIASIGLLPGLVVLVIVGLINMLTIAAMAEAVVRNGSIRYQGNYLGRLVQDYLGRTGSTLLTFMVILHCSLALIVLYIGFSQTLAGMLPFPPEIWVAVLFLPGFFMVRRNALNATVTSALVVGAASIVLILLLSGLALIHLQPAYLLHVHVPFLQGAPFEPALLGLIFGVVFSAYFGHFSASSCARVVLQRDPGGRSLIQGCMAALASVIFLYILWAIAVNGAIAPQALAGFSGTALVPLAKLVGPVASLCGALLAILTMGMASIHMSMTLISMVREWIPSYTRHMLLLARRQGGLIFTPRRTPQVHLALTYLGLKKSQARFSLELRQKEEIRRFEIGVDTTWEASAFLADLAPALPSRSIYLALKVVKAGTETVRVQCTTTMRLAYEGKWDMPGFDFLLRNDADDAQTDVLRWLADREDASLEEIADFLQDEWNAQAAVNTLVEQGFIVETGEKGQVFYRAHFVPRRRRQLPSTLEQTLDHAEKAAARERNAARQMRRWMWLRRMKELAQGEDARSWLAMSPLLLLFLFVEWLLVNGLASFSQLLSFRGVVTVAVIGTVFPVLLLLAGRRKGENIPGLVLPFLAHPLLAVSMFLIATGSLFLHGLLIWQDPLQKAIALLVGTVVLIITWLVVRQGNFTRRLVIELRQDAVGNGLFAVTDSGRAARQVSARLDYGGEERLHSENTGSIQEFSALSSATFSISSICAGELKVWLHRVTPQGYSEQLPALVTVCRGEDSREFRIDGTSQPLILPLSKDAKQERQGNPVEKSQLVVIVQLIAHSMHEPDFS